MSKLVRIIRSIIRLPGKLVNVLILKLNLVEYGANLRINGRIKVFSRGKITIGNDVTMNSSLKSNPIGGQTRTTMLVKKGGRIRIGNRVGISNASLVAFSSITVEDDVYIGAGCKIYDTDFHSLDYEERVHQGDSNIAVSDVLIKKGAFIGAHSILLKGIIIGEKSIIGAGSVVTRNVPDGEIWAGNPAKLIRKVDPVL
ncbi:MAG TPA: acyltransferase [Mobilitalea sp.]|nr:acyltransferase [Mobilitalea sp.]